MPMWRYAIITYLREVARVGVLDTDMSHRALQHAQLNERYSDTPFAACYFCRADGKRQWSLRSRGNFDVSEVARRFGGGGHNNAAGYTEAIE